jgi:hypothetical protein
VTTLLDNHYHTPGYLTIGEELGEMMRKIHGSIAWMVMKEIRVRTCRSGATRDVTIILTGAFETSCKQYAHVGTRFCKPSARDSCGIGAIIRTRTSTSRWTLQFGGHQSWARIWKMFRMRAMSVIRTNMVTGGDQAAEAIRLT